MNQIIFIGFVISTFFGLITLVVYVLIAKTIITHWHLFNSSYYKLYLVSSVLNVASYLNSYPILRLPNVVCKGCPLWSVYDQGDFPGLTTMRFLYVYLMAAMISTEIYMSFNRYTAIAYHQSYDKIWSYLFPISIIGTQLVALTVAYPSYINPTIIVYVEDADLYRPTATEDINRREITVMIGECVAAVVLFLQGAMTIRALWKMPLLPNRATEGKLFIHSCLNSFCTLNIAIYACCLHFIPGGFLHDYGNVILVYLFDLITFTSPYGLILCSSELRRHICLRKPRAYANNSVLAVV